MIARRGDIARLVAACDPDAGQRSARAGQFMEWNARIHERFDAVLAEPIDAVWLPLPISLHLPFVAESLKSGKSVLCEKPAAATVQEVDAMIAARDAANLPVFIAYQHLADPAILRLKQRLVAGELGEIHSATATGCWPRRLSYFSRNTWAGRLRENDAWVLDSPLANAMSHHLQLAMFLLGSQVEATAAAERIEAELYRVNAIENFDTCSVRVQMENQRKLLILFTHASRTTIDPTIEIVGTRGRVRVIPENFIEWHGPGGEEIIPLSKKPGDCLLEAFCRSIHRQPADGMLASLEIARAPVAVVNGVSECASVADVPFSVLNAGDDPVNYIPEIESVFEKCAATGQMIHESGEASWSVAAGQRDMRGYARFSEPASAAR